MTRLSLPGISLASLVFFSACAHRSPHELPPEPAPAVLETERIQKTVGPDEIRPGFLIAIRSPQDRKLQTEARVDPEGQLSLPYGRRIKAEGLTMAALTERIRATYADLYRSTQEVEVRLVQRKYWIEVRGLGQKTGRKLIQPQTRLEEIWAQTEPGPEKADFARLEWNGRTQWIDLKQYTAGQWPSEKNPVWIGGETLWFTRGTGPGLQDSPQIRLMGEVGQPGSFPFDSSKSVLDYIGAAGGLKSSADPERIYLYRQGQLAQGPAEFSLLEPMSFKLAPGDTLLVSNERLDRTERRFQLGANLAAILSAIGILVIAF